MLTDKGYITLDVLKTENNILEEVINLNNFYERISTFLINSEVDIKEENKKENILQYVEQELGRPLNSLEIKTIHDWQEAKIDDSLIMEALKIALNDGVYSLKYIDKILFDFKNRGYQNALDIKKEVEPTSTKSNEIEFVDWNWLDDEEEYIVN